MNYVWEVRVPPGPRTASDGSPLGLGPGVTHRPWSKDNTDTRPSRMMYISNGKWEIEAMVCYSYYMALTVEIAQLCYTSTLPWNIRYAWSLRVPPGPGTTRNGSLLVLGTGVTHHPWSYGQVGTLPSDVYVQWRMKVKAFLLFIVSLIFGVACSATIHTFCTVEYDIRLRWTGPSWSKGHEWRVTLGPRTRSDPTNLILRPGGTPLLA